MMRRVSRLLPLLVVGWSLGAYPGHAAGGPPGQAQAGARIPSVVQQRLGKPMAKPVPSGARPQFSAAGPQVPTLTQAGGGAGMTRRHQINTLGIDQEAEPPDTQIAVGPNHIVEADNTAVGIWPRSAPPPAAPAALFDLQLFYGVPNPLFVADPRIQWDTLAGRWFMSATEVDGATYSRSSVLLAVTTPASASDPAFANWNVYTIATKSDGISDQPRLGVSGDKVVLTWDAYPLIPCPPMQPFPCFGNPVEDGVAVLKDDLLNGASVPRQSPLFTPSQQASFFAVVGAQSQSATTDEWMVANDMVLSDPVSHSSSVTLLRVSGRPDLGNVQTTATSLNLATQTKAPPNGLQPGDAPTMPSISTGDNRIQGVVWRGGFLWTAVGDDCVPSGGTHRACMRFLKLNTSSLSIAQELEGAVNGSDVYYPAVTTDASGNMITGFTISSTTTYPSAAYSGEPAGASGLAPITTISNATTTPYAGTRWGDYSGAAVDPACPSEAWVAAETDAATATDPSHRADWGTVIAHLTFSTPSTAAPCVTSLSPKVGTSRANTPVTITGGGFFAGGSACAVTSITFGGAAASPWSCTDTGITTNSPAHASGAVDVTVSTANGTSATSPADTFTYLGDQFHTLSPVRVLDTRPDGPRTGTCNPGCFQLLSGGHIDVTVTGGQVPSDGSADAVVMNVTVVAGGAVQRFITVWPTGSPQPFSSNLNAFGGQTVSNLVAVPIGAGGQVSVYNDLGWADVIFDVAGYYTRTVSGADGQFTPKAPGRILDTRPSSATGSCSSPCGTLGPGQELKLHVAGAIPFHGSSPIVPASGAEAVTVNITAVQSAGPESFVTAYPTGSPRPSASNINVSSGRTVPNRATVKLGDSGEITIFNNAGSVDIVVDVNGWFSDPSATESSSGLFVPVLPARVMDTRPGGPRRGACTPSPCSQLGAASSLSLQVAGFAGVPGMATSMPPAGVVLNVTAVGTNGQFDSFVIVYPGDAAQPESSDLNILGGQTIPKMVVVKLASDGSIRIYNNTGATDIVVDAFGWYT